MSVAVTHSKPPSTGANTADSNCWDGVPYGSKSTTSKHFSCCNATTRTSPQLVTILSTRAFTSSDSSALYRLLFSTAKAAVGSKSLATIHLTSSNSLAYRIALKPVAHMPSKIVIGSNGVFSVLISISSSSFFFSSTFVGFGIVSFTSSPATCHRNVPGFTSIHSFCFVPSSFFASFSLFFGTSFFEANMRSLSSSLTKYSIILLSFGTLLYIPFPRLVFWYVSFSYSSFLLF
mmetsp:Transcript_3627/g.11154  ORF Transcript_3627/g.11154 Transcript_3627/m.11154 type:complete len:233 (+) Transcript_3627:1088-1786(+)